MTDAPVVLHGTAVAWESRALLIRGASGRGKSALALQLMAWGAGLVADDRVCLAARADGVELSAPAPIRGLIEARGLGLLRAEAVAGARLAAILDLDRAEPQRLPPARHETVLGHRVVLLHNFEHAHFAAALLQYLKAGRKE
ncbi:HPr kinase/phosphorylase [Roseivivax sp. CAU 1761]